MWLFRRKERLSPEVEKVFDKLLRFLAEEDVQNESYKPELQRELRSNGKADVVPGAQGEFGFDPKSPVPVNGPIGELIYLSSLELLSGQKVVFHRLGSLNTLDVYEVMALDGSFWCVLFLNMYFAGKSHRAPRGFQIIKKPDVRFLRGTNARVDAFPSGLYDAAAAFANPTFGMTLVDTDLKELDNVMLRRPAAHGNLVDTICSRVHGWS